MTGPKRRLARASRKRGQTRRRHPGRNAGPMAQVLRDLKSQQGS